MCQRLGVQNPSSCAVEALESRRSAMRLPSPETSSLRLRGHCAGGEAASLQELGPIYAPGNRRPTASPPTSRPSRRRRRPLSSSGQSRDRPVDPCLAVAGSNVVASSWPRHGSVTLLKNTGTIWASKGWLRPSRARPEAWRALADDKTVAFCGPPPTAGATSST